MEMHLSYFMLTQHGVQKPKYLLWIYFWLFIFRGKWFTPLQYKMPHAKWQNKRHPTLIVNCLNCPFSLHQNPQQWQRRNKKYSIWGTRASPCPSRNRAADCWVRLGQVRPGIWEWIWEWDSRVKAVRLARGPGLEALALFYSAGAAAELTRWPKGDNSRMQNGARSTAEEHW